MRVHAVGQDHKLRPGKRVASHRAGIVAGLLGAALLWPLPAEALTADNIRLPQDSSQAMATRQVSGLLAGPAEVSALREQGVQVVISLLPAEEETFDEQRSVEAAGMRFIRIAVAGTGDLTREKVQAFDQALSEAGQRQTLIHCASGNRVGALMALRAAWIEGKPADQALAEGRASGLTRLSGTVSELISPR